MNKKVFVVERKSPASWGEYATCLIGADNIDEVHDIIDRGDIHYRDNGREDRRITETFLCATKSGAVMMEI